MGLFTQELVNGVVSGAVYVLTAIGLSLIFGTLKVVNFAHGEFYMVGGFFAFLLTDSLGVAYLPAVLMAGVGGAIIGLAAERIAVRPLRRAPEDTVFLSTFGLSLILLYSVKALLGAEPRLVFTPFIGIINVGGIILAQQQVLVIAVAIVLIALLFLTLRRSKIGLAVRAVALDRDTAGLMGINVDRVYMLTFATAAGIAAVAGALVAPLFTVNPFSGQDVLIKAFIVVIAAGLGSLPGTVIVGMGLGIAENMAAGYLPAGSRDFVGYILIALVLLLRPQGLFGTARAHG